MGTWEYETRSCYVEDLVGELNESAAEGWELVSVVPARLAPNPAPDPKKPDRYDVVGYTVIVRRPAGTGGE